MYESERAEINTKKALNDMIILISAQSWLIVQHDESCGVNNRPVQTQQLQQSTTHRQTVQTSEGPSIYDIIVHKYCNFTCFVYFAYLSCFHLNFQNPDSGPSGNVFKGKNPKNGKKMSYILHFERSPGRLLLAAAVNASSDKL